MSGRTMRLGLLVAAAAVCVTLVVLTFLRDAIGAQAEQVYENPSHKDPLLEVARLRSEGVAHFESGIGLKKALAAFQAAEKLAPRSAIELYNLAATHRKLGDVDKSLELLAKAAPLGAELPQIPYTRGLIERGRGDTAESLKAFEEARGRAPQESSVYYQLGRLYREAQQEAQALQAFVHALQLDPQHTGTMYQLFLYYQERGEADRAKAMFDEFSRVKRALSSSRKELNDDESWLARPIVAPTAASRPAARKAEGRFQVVALPGIENATAIAARDLDGDGLDELLIGRSDGKVALLRNSGGLRFEAKATYDLGGSERVTGLDAVTLVRDETYRLVATSAAGVLVSDKDLSAPKLGFTSLSTTPARQVYRADLDHDGDVDLFTEAFREVWLNDGAAGFTRTPYLDEASRKALAKLTGPIVAVDVLDRSGIDFVMHGADGTRALLADALGGRHARKPFAKLANVESLSAADAADLDNDGRIDLIAYGKRHIHIGYHDNGYEFSAAKPIAAASSDKASALAIGDFDNDGWKDLLEIGAGQAVWHRNAGERKFERRVLGAKLGGTPQGAPLLTDLDRDGRLDAVVVLDSGRVAVLKNETPQAGRSMRITLAGVRSAPSGLHTLIEVRRGNMYAKYAAQGGALDLPLGEGDYAEILRIKWPNGFVESKLNVRADQRWHFKESERVSGSCPSVFAWDGGQFRFITDAFISGPMGVPYGPGSYFPVDHDEYLKIPGEALNPVENRLRIAITEELREAVFLDRVRLLAVDHPADTEIYPNEYLRAGDFPEFKVHVTRSAMPPSEARDLRGEDVTHLVRAVDRRYPTGFRRLQYEGLAEENGVEFALPEGAALARSLRLFLTGWFHYFESTSLVAVSQREDLRPEWPQVEVLDHGEWRKIVEIGIPSGKDKTVVVDLTRRLPPDARRLRIRTNLALYWDRIAIDVEREPREVQLARLDLVTARLRFKGFSAFEPVAPRDAPQPERFVYSAARYEAPWNPLEGAYTRYGSVDELLGRVDSRMAVFGSGDELLLEFDATALPPPQAGYRRDYLLYLNGYVKDGDKYTAHAGKLDPAPYAGLTSYPYDPRDGARRIFSTPEYRAYLAQYQTRAPLNFTGPALAASAPATGERARSNTAPAR